MEFSSFREADSHLADREIFRLLWNPEAHIYVRTSTPVASYLKPHKSSQNPHTLSTPSSPK